MVCSKDQDILIQETTKKSNCSSQLLHIFALKSEMVRQAGFEPTTLWFVARYSIQLSYWRTYFFALILGANTLKIFSANCVVRQAGFEPTTLWFVARYSIQLSYWRIKICRGRTIDEKKEKSKSSKNIFLRSAKSPEIRRFRAFCQRLWRFRQEQESICSA